MSDSAMKMRAAFLTLVTLAAVGTVVAGTEPPPVVFEGRPDRGFAYRLLLPSPKPEDRPARLVVWLHPTGGTFDAEVEALAPVFTTRGYALLIPAHDDSSGWAGADAGKLLAFTLPHAASQPGVDGSRPILFGFSGGGQLALALWHTRPDRFGGAIVDAAYPLDQREGTQIVMPPPTNPAVRSSPLFALVGAKDPVAKVWRDVAKKWRAAGVPLTVRFVEGRGHEWLFDAKETAALAAWLVTLSTGG